jgi:hypothetical protein
MFALFKFINRDLKYNKIRKKGKTALSAAAWSKAARRTAGGFRKL